MKKLFILLSLIAMVFIVNANPVDQNTAKEIGKKFLQVSAEMKIADAENLQLVKTYNTREGDVAFYIFNTEKGFVIVSAVDYAIPVLGYSDEGCFNLENIPIQMEEYLLGFVEQIQYGKDNNIVQNEETATQWNLVSATGRINDKKATEAVAPLLTTTWGQGSENANYGIYRRYNIMCPADAAGPNGHTIVGCTATAAAQIMRYWSYPTTGNGSHTYTPSNYPQQSVNFGTTTYDWANMPNELNSSSTTAQNNAVALISWHVGVAIDTEYGPDGSSAYPSDIPGALVNYFRYSSDLYSASKNNYSDANWLNMVKESLDQSQPVFYAGWNSNGGGGHSFVCDGYNSSDQLHFNWGWNGSENNYFSLGALIAGGYDFSYNNYAIFNIHPLSNPSQTYQINVTASPTTGGTVTGGGTYQQYQLCTLTASPASGYNFVGWKENNTIVSTEPTYSFIVRQNRNIVAAFSLPAISSVAANYYPDANNPESPYVEVSWMGESTHYEGFENGIPSDWTVIDANNDGYTWTALSDVPTNWTYYSGYTLDWYRSGSNAVVSGSYINDVGALTPNEYLVTPQISLSGRTTFSFWAAACDSNYPADHFGVAVSTTTPTASAFSMVQEWTMTAKSTANGGRESRNGNGAKVGTWYNYTVDLSAYAGEQVYIAIRHFNCYDQYIICIDDVEYTTGGATPGEGQWYHYDNGVLGNNIGAGGAFYWAIMLPAGTYSGDFVTKVATYYSGNSGYAFSGTATIYQGGTSAPSTQIGTVSVATSGSTAGFVEYEFATPLTIDDSQNLWVVFYNETSTSYCATAFAETGSGDVNGRLVSFDGSTWMDLATAGVPGCGWMLRVYVAQSAKGAKDGQQIQYYKVYRTNCDNNGPYNSSNTTTLASQETGTSFIDNTWSSLGFGSYKFGVSANYVDGTESNIIWSSCIDKGMGYTIIATANPTSGGTITGAGLYEEGTTCTLTAAPNTGYEFVNWTKNGTVVSTNTTFSFTVTENASYVAHFNLITYDVTASANPTNGGSVTGGGTFTQGATCTLVATANTGYTFVNWTKNGTAISTNPTYSFTVNETASYVANFSLNTYNITVTANPTAGGNVTGGGTFNHGETCTLTASPNTDWNFTNWTKNGNVVSANASYTFTVTENANYVANFTQNVYYTIVASAYPAEGGTVDGSGTFLEGETCTLTATANTGYTFVNWTKNNTIVSTNATFSFTVVEAAEYIANFDITTYNVSTVANPANGGTVTGDGVYAHGETATLSVTPNTNYVFDNWTENGVVVSENPTFSVEITEAHNYVANFHSVEGVDETDAEMFVMYPNPANDIIYIESLDNINRCEVLTLTGAMVFSKTDCSQSFKLEIGNLKSGTYMIRMISSNSVQTKVFIKK